jgi:hypothetical protein
MKEEQLVVHYHRRWNLRLHFREMAVAVACRICLFDGEQAYL